MCDGAGDFAHTNNNYWLCDSSRNKILAFMSLCWLRRTSLSVSTFLCNVILFWQSHPFCVNPSCIGSWLNGVSKNNRDTLNPNADSSIPGINGIGDVQTNPSERQLTWFDGHNHSKSVTVAESCVRSTKSRYVLWQSVSGGMELLIVYYPPGSKKA